MEDAIYDVATAAYDQLLTARSIMNQIPADAFPAFLSAVCTIRWTISSFINAFNFRCHTLSSWKIWRKPTLIFMMQNCKRKTGSYRLLCTKLIRHKRFKQSHVL